MKRTLLLIPIMALLIVSIAVAQSSGNYDLSWSTIDGGGGSSIGGSYSLSGTIGQPDATVSSGGSYALNGGFWNSRLVPYQIYLPIVLR
jgi:hypothetical protein